MVDFFELDERVEKYIKKYDNLFYMVNLQSNLSLLEESKNLLDPYKKLNMDHVRLSFHDKIDGLTSVSLVREYLGSLNEEYVKIFDECFRNGTFGFGDVYNDENLKDLDFAGINKDHPFFNVAFAGNIEDGEKIVHEFFHYLNLSDFVSREFFTEFISIYMENKYLDFLEIKGYSKNDIAKARLDRYLNFYHLRDALYYETAFLNVAKEVGVYDYEFLMKYKDTLKLPSVSKENFEKNLEKILKKLCNLSDEKSNNQSFRPHVSYCYFIGTILSSYLLTREDETITKKVLQLNDKLPNCESVFDGFKILGLDLNDISMKDLIDSVNIYYDEVVANFIVSKTDKHKTK